MPASVLQIVDRHTPIRTSLPAHRRQRGSSVPPRDACPRPPRIGSAAAARARAGLVQGDVAAGAAGARARARGGGRRPARLRRLAARAAHGRGAGRGAGGVRRGARARAPARRRQLARRRGRARDGRDRHGELRLCRLADRVRGRPREGVRARGARRHARDRPALGPGGVQDRPQRRAAHAALLARGRAAVAHPARGRRALAADVRARRRRSGSCWSRSTAGARRCRPARPPSPGASATAC